MLVACPKETAVWLGSDSADVGSLVFELGRTPGVREPVQLFTVTVRSCEDSVGENRDAFWVIADTVASVPPDYPTRIKYGEVPTHFEELIEPKTLTPGCFVVQTGGSGSTRFKVAAGGEVTSVN